MEKFKERLSLLRAEAESATATGDEYASKIKLLEEETNQKGHEITSEQVKIERLEKRLEIAESGLIKVNIKSSESAVREEEAERNVRELEQRLEDAEKRNEELKGMNQTIREELEEFIRQVEVS